MRYLIEFATTKVTPVTVNADTQQEAIESALRQEGEAGDTYYQDMEILAVRPVD